MVGKAAVRIKDLAQATAIRPHLHVADSSKCIAGSGVASEMANKLTPAFQCCRIDYLQ